jgi:PAS domain-containing protein
MNPAVATPWSFTEDIVPLLGYLSALIAILMLPVRRGGTFNVAAKAFFAASVMVYLTSTTTSILGHFGMFPDALSPVVTSIELLWVPLVLFGVYAVYSNQQLNDSIAARHEVVRSSHMLERVMDTAPAGVVVLDDAGGVTFANPEARRLLDMETAPGSDAGAPVWSVCVGDDPDGSRDRRCDFSELLGPQPLLDVPVTVSWPNGWRRRLIVNTTPVSDDAGDVTGAVVAFVEREPWSAAVRAATTTEDLG